MRFYSIAADSLPKVILLGKETLIPPRKHLSRRLTEHVLYVVVRGGLDLSVNGEALSLVPGDICLFASGDEQEPRSAGFCEYYYVHFLSDSLHIIPETEESYSAYLLEKQERIMKTDFFSPKCYEYLTVRLRMKNHVEDEKEFSEICEMMQRCTLSSESRFPEKRFAVSAAAASLFLKLEKYSAPGKNDHPGNPVKTYETVRRIAAYIEEHYAEPVTGADIEENFFLSFDYCNRIFGKIMGCSIIRYRNMVRIQHAKAEMRTSAPSVGEAAAMVGFENTYYFSRAFKKEEGLTPTEYKKKFMKLQEDKKETP